MTQSILTVTPAASRKIQSARDSDRANGAPEDVALRIRVREEGASFRYELSLVAADSRQQGDSLLEAGDVPVLVDEESVPRLRGATLDYVEDITGSGLKFENPNRTRLASHPLAERVQRILDDRINPMVGQHGGHVGLADIDGSRVFLRFGGGCQGCGMVDVTLKQGIVETLRQELPEVSEVLDVTDHQAGDNPYY
jgi:Fe/S biogenesis protein NfuA